MNGCFTAHTRSPLTLLPHLRFDLSGKLKPSILIVHNKVCVILVQNKFYIGKPESMKTCIRFCRLDRIIFISTGRVVFRTENKKLCFNTAETRITRSPSIFRRLQWRYPADWKTGRPYPIHQKAEPINRSARNQCRSPSGSLPLLSY